MKQRSLKMSREPKKSFPECARSSFLHVSRKPKPCSLGRKQSDRKIFMNFYKMKRHEDRAIGIEINKLFQQFFCEKRMLEQSDNKVDPDAIQRLGELAKQIKKLQETKRVKQDFPSFSSFYAYVRSEGVTVQDIYEE